MPAWVKGEATDSETALAAASALLGGARAPVIAGLSADVAAIRAAYDLAGRIGASVDTAGAAGTYAELGALSRAGAITTTPAEVVGRADVILVIGSAPWGAAILESLAVSRPTRGRAAGEARTVLALGGSGPGATLFFPAESGLPEAIAHLRAVCRGHLSGDATVTALAERLFTARYAAVLYDPAEIGEIGVEMLQGLAIGLNENVRCFTLALSGPGQDRAVVPVAAWTTGQAPRTGFGRSVPEHDPWRFDAARLAAAGEVDAVLWLAALPAPRPGWLAAVPSVALVGEAQADAADVVIQVGVPGRDFGGVLWNEPRAALTYWPAAAPTDLPSAASVIGALKARLTHAQAVSRQVTSGQVTSGQVISRHAASRSEPAC